MRLEENRDYENQREVLAVACNGILRKNRDTLLPFYDAVGLAEAVRQMAEEESSRVYLSKVIVSARSIDSIYEELGGRLKAHMDIGRLLAEERIPLLDMFLIFDGRSPGCPDEMFFKFYGGLHKSPYQFTITGFREDVEEAYRSCYIMSDWYGNRYRLFVQSEREYGLFVRIRPAAGEMEDADGKPGDNQAGRIIVYTDEGRPVEIEESSTILDYAFVLNREAALYIKSAYLNRPGSRAGLDTVLQNGDKVWLVWNQEKTGQPKLNWLRFVKTQLAKECLVAYFEGILEE